MCKYSAGSYFLYRMRFISVIPTEVCLCVFLDFIIVEQSKTFNKDQRTHMGVLQPKKESTVFRNELY